MSKRLQVILPDEEMEPLRDAELQRPLKIAAAKLGAIREAVQHSYPTADIDDMNREIERGYGN